MRGLAGRWFALLNLRPTTLHRINWIPETLLLVYSQTKMSMRTMKHKQEFYLEASEPPICYEPAFTRLYGHLCA